MLENVTRNTRMWMLHVWLENSNEKLSLTVRTKLKAAKIYNFIEITAELVRNASILVSFKIARSRSSWANVEDPRRCACQKTDESELFGAKISEWAALYKSRIIGAHNPQISPRMHMVYMANAMRACSLHHTPSRLLDVCLYNGYPFELEWF